MASHVDAISKATNVVGKVFEQPKGDFADRLNSRTTVFILALSAVSVYAQHFMNTPITCVVPSHLTGAWPQFVNQYCYLHGTYFAGLDQQLEFNDKERWKNSINYYQWVPYVLAIQALFFYFPRFLWKSLLSRSGYDLAAAIRYVNITWELIRHNKAPMKNCEEKFKDASTFIWHGLKLARKRKSYQMGFYYTIATVVQALNAWFQWLCWSFLFVSPDYPFYSLGPSVVIDLLSGKDWQKTGHFPRIVHCDFHHRRPASVQIDTVLCVLGLNIYYEKLFIFLWFWLCVVALISTANCCIWLFRLFTDSSRSNIETYFYSYTGKIKNATKDSIDDFFQSLEKDGLFVLQQMRINLGDMPTSHLTVAMFKSIEMVEQKSVNDDEGPAEETDKLV